MLSKELKTALAETLLKTYQENQPKLIELIKEGLAKGATPRSLERFAKQIPTTGITAVPAHIYIIAKYLKDNPNKTK